MDFFLTHFPQEDTLHGQRIGYVRVSSFDQNPERQLEQIQVDKVFTDKASGRTHGGPNWNGCSPSCAKATRSWCTAWIVWRATSTTCAAWCRGLTQRGVRIEFLKEHLTFTGEDSPMANLMLSVMGAFAEFERALIRERQREGIALAKQRGPTVAGRNPCRLSVLPNCANVSRLASKRPSWLVNSESVAKPCINT